MAADPSPAAGPPTSSSTARRVGSLLMALLGMVGTFYGAFANYGWFTAISLVAIFLFFIGLALTTPYVWRSNPVSWFVAWLISIPNATGWVGFGTLLAGLFLMIVVWGVLPFLNLIEPSFFRRHYTDRHDRIRLNVVDFAEVHFKELDDDQLVNQQTEEQCAYNRWLSWMAQGAAENTLPGDKAMKEEVRLIYVEGAPFDDNYTDVQGFVTVSEPMTVVSGVAFLKRDRPRGHASSEEISSRWYKPEMRSMLVVPLEKRKAAFSVLTDPNKGESPVFLLQVKVPPNVAFPGRDQLLMNNEIGVKQ